MEVESRLSAVKVFKFQEWKLSKEGELQSRLTDLWRIRQSVCSGVCSSHLPGTSYFIHQTWGVCYGEMGELDLWWLKQSWQGVSESSTFLAFLCVIFRLLADWKNDPIALQEVKISTGHLLAPCSGQQIYIILTALNHRKEMEWQSLFTHSRPAQTLVQSRCTRRSPAESDLSLWEEERWCWIQSRCDEEFLLKTFLSEFDLRSSQDKNESGKVI